MYFDFFIFTYMNQTKTSCYYCRTLANLLAAFVYLYNLAAITLAVAFGKGRGHTEPAAYFAKEVSIHKASPVWFVHWLAIHRASPVPIYAIWLYTGLDRTYYSFVFL